MHGAGSLLLTPGFRYWQRRAHNRIGIRLGFIPANRIEVCIWWNRSSGIGGIAGEVGTGSEVGAGANPEAAAAQSPDVQLIFGLYEESVELGMLTGNGFDAPGFHRQGFGTLLVNTAVQALQSVCPEPMLVHGLLSNTAESALTAERRRELEANRRAFWRRFGLDVLTLGDPPLDYLRGRVGGLKVVAGGSVAGEFPRLVPLEEFSETRPAEF